jgi:PTS system mannose-specific IIA component
MNTGHSPYKPNPATDDGQRGHLFKGVRGKIPLAPGLWMVNMWPFRAVHQSAREEFWMIGLVLVTHGRLADEFKAALEHVMGPQNKSSRSRLARKTMPICVAAISSKPSSAWTAATALRFTDMFGGTPSNLAISCMSRPKVEVLAGINLPMLVKLAKVRDDKPLPDAIAAAQEAGRKYVTIASRVLAGK